MIIIHETALLMAAAVAAPQGSERISIPEPTGLSPLLSVALEGVHRFEREAFLRGLFTPDGVVHPRPFEGQPTEDDPLYRFLLKGLDDHVDPGPSLHFPGHDGFAFEGERPTLAHLLECGRYDAGYRGATELLEADPGFDPADLLDALSHGALQSLPVAADPLAAKLHLIAARQQRLAPLGRASLAYVAWGVLMHERAWQREPGDKRMVRADFISAVLQSGSTSTLSSWICERVLQPPLRWTSEKPGRGIALPHGRSRGRIGFGERDQEFLESLRRDLVMGSSVDSGPMVKEGPAKDPGAPITRRRLETWLAVMVDRVLRDRGTALAANEAMRRGSIAERLRFWSDLASSAPFEQFHGAVVVELASMVEGSAGFPEDARVRALEEAQAQRPLSAEEEAELASLRRERRGAQVRLAKHLLRLVPAAGGPHRVAAVAASFSGEIHQALEGFGQAGDRDRLLATAWVGLSTIPSDQGVWVVEDHLERRMELSRDGAYAMVAGLVMHERAGAEPLLARVMEQGGIIERAAAVANPYWMSQGRFVEQVEALIPRTVDPTLAHDKRETLRLSLISAMRNWRGPEGRELLLSTFEKGHWAEGAEGSSWSNIARGPWLTETLELLSESDRADLVKRGLATRGLFER